MDKVTCDNCIFSRADGGKLVCTRYPPIPQVVTMQGLGGPEPAVISNYPPVAPGMWCGEHSLEPPAIHN